MLSRYALTCLQKQCHLADLIGGRPWHFDTRIGRLSFGDDLQWQTEILGTESHQNNTWLWAWANFESNLPANLIQASLEMKRLGEQCQIPEFIEPQISLSYGFNGHVLAMIASGVSDADAYYRGPYEGGAAFLLIKDPKFPRSTEPPLVRLATAFPQMISALPIHDHKLVLTSYLDQCGIAHEENEGSVIVRENNQPILSALFDRHNRLIKLDVRLEGAR